MLSKWLDYLQPELVRDALRDSIPGFPMVSPVSRGAGDFR